MPGRTAAAWQGQQQAMGWLGERRSRHGCGGQTGGREAGAGRSHVHCAVLRAAEEAEAEGRLVQRGDLGVVRLCVGGEGGAGLVPKGMRQSAQLTEPC